MSIRLNKLSICIQQKKENFESVKTFETSKTIQPKYFMYPISTTKNGTVKENSN